MSYEHTQRGFTPIIVLLWLVIVAAIIAAFAGDELGAALLSMGLSSVVVVLVVFWFNVLRIRVTGTTIKASFGPGWPRRSYELADLVAFGQVRNKWYYGWGIRRIQTGWMYSVWGLDAVELELAAGKKFTIGTNEPAELLGALEARTSLKRSR